MVCKKINWEHSNMRIIQIFLMFIFSKEKSIDKKSHADRLQRENQKKIEQAWHVNEVKPIPQQTKQKISNPEFTKRKKKLSCQSMRSEWSKKRVPCKQLLEIFEGSREHLGHFLKVLRAYFSKYIPLFFEVLRDHLTERILLYCSEYRLINCFELLLKKGVRPSFHNRLWS